MSALLAILLWASFANVALASARAPWKLQERKHDRRQLQQDISPLTSVCMDQWPLPQNLNATEMQRFGNPCPGNFSYFACCNAADQCYAWSKSTNVLTCNSFVPNCCSHPSTNFTGRMFYPPRPGITLKAKSVKWSKDLDAAPPATAPHGDIPRRGYIIAAGISAAIVLAIAAAVVGAVLCVCRRIKAQAAATGGSQAPPKTSAYAPAITQPWSLQSKQSVSIPEPSGLYPTQSTELMLPKSRSQGLSQACSTEPMLHHPGGPVSSLASACSMETALPIRPGRPGPAAGASREHCASSGSSGLNKACSAEPMLPMRTSSDMSQMYSAELLMSTASSSGLSSSSARSTEAMLPKRPRGEASSGSRPPHGSQAYRPPLPFASLDDLTFKACYRIA